MIHTALQSVAGAGGRARAEPHRHGRSHHGLVKELAPAVFLIVVRAGLDVRRPRHAVGSGGRRRARRADRGPPAGRTDAAGARGIAIGAVQTCSMIALIVLGASILGSAAAFLGIPAAVAEFVTSLQLSPFMLIVALIVFYLILGCFLDGFQHDRHDPADRHADREAAGFDPIWFGIFLVLVVEMAQITPPVGFNLFVIQGLTGGRAGLYRQGHAALSADHGPVHHGHHTASRHCPLASPLPGQLISLRRTEGTNGSAAGQDGGGCPQDHPRSVASPM